MNGPEDDDMIERPRTGLMDWVRRSAMVLAPIGVVVGIFVIMGIMDATKPKPEKKDEAPGALAVGRRSCASTTPTIASP
jgi:hypothetical protein